MEFGRKKCRGKKARVPTNIPGYTGINIVPKYRGIKKRGKGKRNTAEGH